MIQWFARRGLERAAVAPADGGVADLTMPGVDWKLDEQPMAGLLGDIRQALDSRAPLVDAAAAAAVRKDVQTADLPAHDHKRCPLSDRNALMRAIAAKVSDAEIDAADDMQNLP